MMTDKIADMLTRIRNGVTSGAESISVPTSKMLVALAKILKEEGYIENYKEEKGDAFRKNIVITFKFFEGKNVISGLKRISTPGLRVYSNAQDIPQVLSGMGIAIVSTNKGIITDKAAKAQNVGGEVLAYVW
ncbi:MAG: 30S ribosomal protein S8 [Firmicutes bacterium]|nr:30S ribosomal protein S8 [Bacillota bacterium]